jgi:hypothetical protein
MKIMSILNSNVSVFKTKNYDMFKFIKGNRPVDEANVVRIMKSFAVEYLYTVVILNEFFEIIDGQHRIEACRRMGLEVNYTIVPGLRLKDCQLYNTVGKIWTKKTFHESYCELGSPAYLLLEEFRRTYPEFTLSTAEAIITNNVAGMDNTGREKLGNGKTKDNERIHYFREGLFIVKNKVKGYETAAKIREYKPYFQYYNNGTFARTLIALFKKSVYNHERMLDKLKKQPNTLVKCPTATAYLQLLDKIYNYGSRTNDKVSLQYGK